MKKALKQASTLMDSSEAQIREYIHDKDSAITFYRSSIHRVGKAIIAMARDHKSRFLLVLSSRNAGTITKFSGEKIDGGGVVAKKCPLNERNASVLRELFPWVVPVPQNNSKTIIGCGDRLGIATPGHIAAVKQFDVFPILIQNSIKQLKLIKKTFKEVVDNTTFLVYQSGYKNGFGADSNQLKNLSDINIALAAGIPMITLDLEEFVDTKAKLFTHDQVNKAYEKLPQRIKKRVKDNYINREFTLSRGSITINRIMAKRCAVMYYKAIDFVDKAYQHISANRPGGFDLEIALNDKAAPTLAEEHLFIINELNHRNISICSLAPKFVGNFRRGLDYKDDVDAFSEHFAVHCDIANAFGNYKISIHTGSDKYSIYPTIGELSSRRFHLKTAGTSWLESLKVIAAKTPVLYRIIHNCAIDNIKESLKYYDESLHLDKLPDIEDLYDEDLPDLIENDYVRQVLHISYGPILNNRSIYPMFFSTMHKFDQVYHDGLKELFTNHLTSLGVPTIK